MDTEGCEKFRVIQCCEPKKKKRMIIIKARGFVKQGAHRSDTELIKN